MFKNSGGRRVLGAGFWLALFLVPAIVWAIPATYTPAVNTMPDREAWVGTEITVWGAVRPTTDPNAVGDELHYSIDFGDGTTATTHVAVSNGRYIAETHTYATTGAKTLRLTVHNMTDSTESYDESVITVVSASGLTTSQVRKHNVGMAIENGLRYLYTCQSSDGSWSGSVAHTGEAVLAFEVQNHLGSNNADEDIYAEWVQKGLDFIFPQAVLGAGYGGSGILWNGEGGPHYSTGIAMTAIVGSNTPNVIAAGGASDGLTYKQVIEQNIVFLAWSQAEGTGWSPAGGWRYSANSSDSDNSISQWPVLGMHAAELWGVSIPPATVTALEGFVNAIQYTNGGSGYDSAGSWQNPAKTGGLLIEQAFLGYPTTDSRVQAALAYLDNNWAGINGSGGIIYDSSSYPNNHGNLYAMYSIMKGLHALNVRKLASGVAWYDSYADWLLANQASSGSWSSNSSLGSGPILGASWGVLILSPTIFPFETSVEFPDGVNSDNEALVEVGYRVKVSYGVGDHVVNGSVVITEDDTVLETIPLTGFSGGGTWTRTYEPNEKTVDTSYEYVSTLTITNDDGVDITDVVVTDSRTVDVVADDMPPAITCLGPDDGSSIDLGDAAALGVITWTIDEPNPDTYTVTKDGVTIASGTYLDGDHIAVPLGVDASGTFVYVLTATDANENSATNTVELNVTAPLRIETVSPPIGNVDVSYELPLVAEGGDGDYTWSIDDGDPETSDNLEDGTLPPGLDLTDADDDGVFESISGTPTAAGFFPFVVVVVDGNDDMAVWPTGIVVNGEAVPTTPLTPTLIAPANASTLIGTQPILRWAPSLDDSGIASYDLVIDDGVPVIVTDTSYQPGSALSVGEHDWFVRANAVDGGASANSTTFTFTIAAISATVTPTTGVAPLAVTFDVPTYDDANSYAWDFAFDTTTELFVPRYASATGGDTLTTYGIPGTYTARLMIGLSDGTSVTLAPDVTVTVTAPPSAPAATVTVTDNSDDGITDDGSGNVPFTVTFDATVATGTPILYEWDFEGDGEFDWMSDATGDTSHTYRAVGTFTATLRVMNAEGLSSTATATVTGEAAVAAPTATITSVSPSQTETGQTVTFKGSGTTASGSLTIAYFEWDYDGDGSYDERVDGAGPVTVTHVYDSPGAYTVRLRVTDQNDADGDGAIDDPRLTSTASASLVVSAPTEVEPIRVWVVQPRDGEAVDSSCTAYSININAVPRKRVDRAWAQWRLAGTAWPADPSATQDRMTDASSAAPAARFEWNLAESPAGTPSVLADGTYQVRGVARDDQGNYYYSDSPDQQGASVSVTVAGGAGTSETNAGGVRSRKQLCRKDRVNKCICGNPTTVTVPYDAIGDDGDVQIDVTRDATGLGTAAGSYGIVESTVREITLSEAPSRRIYVSISYKDDDNDGFVDDLLTTVGAPVSEMDMRLFHYTSGAWQQLPDQVVDPAANQVTAWTTGFSPFALGGLGVEGSAAAGGSSSTSGGAASATSDSTGGGTAGSTDSGGSSGGGCFSGAVSGGSGRTGLCIGALVLALLVVLGRAGARR